MKGVLLAGGHGTRLQPMTHVVNKHVLPVYDEPMIFYPVRTLIDAGINEILVISNSEHLGKYIELIDEADFDAGFSYRVQSKPLGIAHAVKLAEDFVDDTFAVVLGDNIFIGDTATPIESYDGEGAKIFITPVDNPTDYGIAKIDGDRITSIDEKPASPDSNFVATGLYLYPPSVFDIIETIQPSDRGEYEITAVNNRYIARQKLSYHMFEGDWFDAGTPEGLFLASQYVRDMR